MKHRQPYNSGVEEIFSNFSKDPCIDKTCRSSCPIGFTCLRAVPPRSGELRLDFAGCNFQCPFCWTIKKPLVWSADQVHEKIQCRLREYSESDLAVSIAYLRITGGEPIVGRKRAEHMLHLFRLLDDDMRLSELYRPWKTRRAPQNLLGRRNTKIQTNGVLIPRLLSLFIDELRHFERLSFTFEVSLKGTNPEEFEILSGGLPVAGFYEQMRAIEELADRENQGYPIFVRGVLGVFHSDQYDLVFPNDGKMMMNPCVQFKQMMKKLLSMPRRQERFYVEPLRFTDQMRWNEIRCEELGILADADIGRVYKAGKKTSLSNQGLTKHFNPFR